MKLGSEHLRDSVMSRKRNKCLIFLCLELSVLIFTFIFSFLPHCRCLRTEAILLNASPATVKHLHLPYKSRYDIGYFSSNFYRLKSKGPMLSRQPTITVEKYFQIEPSDAIGGTKYSLPATNYHENSYPDMKVPLKNIFKERHLPISAQNPSIVNFQEQTLSHKVSKNSSPPLRDLRFVESTSDKNSYASKSILSSEYKTTEDELNVPQSDMHFNEDSNSMALEKNNFTDSLTHLLPLSSDTVLSYDNPSSNLNMDDSKYLVPVKKSSERAVEDVPSHYSDYPKSTYSDSNHSTLLPVLTEFTSRPSVVLSTHLYIEFVNQTESLDSVTTKVLPSIYDVENISSSSASFDSDSEKFSSATVAGIVIGVLVCVTILSSAVIYILYRKYNGKCASVVEGKFNSDNCGYLDDSLRSSIYLNNHIELPKESSEEMSSLDNDSFLNSLETMTIQNYWADNSKNTKV